MKGPPPPPTATVAADAYAQAAASKTSAHSDAISEAQPNRPPAFDPSVVQSLPMVADGSNPAFADRLLEMFSDNAMQILAAIAEASASGDATTLQRSAHTLKSSSATVGALALSELARQLEMLLRHGDSPASDWPSRLTRAYDEFAGSLAQYRITKAEPKATAIEST